MTEFDSIKSKKDLGFSVISLNPFIVIFKSTSFFIYTIAITIIYPKLISENVKEDAIINVRIHFL